MKWKRFAIATLIVVSTLVLVAWFAGTLLTAPVPRKIGSLPPDLQGRSVEFPSESGSQIHGWFLAGRSGRGLVIFGSSRGRGTLTSLISPRATTRRGS